MRTLRGSGVSALPRGLKLEEIFAPLVGRGSVPPAFLPPRSAFAVSSLWLASAMSAGACAPGKFDCGAGESACACLRYLRGALGLVEFAPDPRCSMKKFAYFMLVICVGSACRLSQRLGFKYAPTAQIEECLASSKVRLAATLGLCNCRVVLPIFTARINANYGGHIQWTSCVGRRQQKNAGAALNQDWIFPAERRECTVEGVTVQYSGGFEVRFPIFKRPYSFGSGLSRRTKAPYCRTART